jgi:hypothetical protein
MKKQIFTYDEMRRNARVKELMSNKKNNLLVSGDTGQLENWNVDEFLPTTNRKDDRGRLVDYEWDNTISKCGMTYLEIEQLNNTYNNFR